MDIFEGMHIDKKEAILNLMKSDDRSAMLALEKEVNHERLVEKWNEDHGERVKRLMYEDLNEDSVVFDVGGYAGNWAADIYCRYGCTVYVFEPVKSFCDVIRQRFSNNSRIKVHDFGLADKNSTEMISILGDGSTLFKEADGKDEVRMVDIVEFMNTNNINSVDLMKLNIEGGEYHLLMRLFGRLAEFKNIQVQFHNFVARGAEMRRNIQEELMKTHVCTYNYDFIWESWRRKT